MFQPTAAEMILFAVLLAASGAVFWMRLGPVVATIRTARPDPGFTLSPVGKRVRDFVWEVLLQAKVIRERFWPGLAHAFVFWGFLAFALVTLNHFAKGLGLAFLAPDGIYMYFAGAFAV